MNRQDIRKNLSYHRIDDYNLFIVPALPSWVVLTDEQAIAFDLFLKGNEKDEIVALLCKEGLRKEKALDVYNELLKKLTDRKIWSNDVAFIAPDAKEYPSNIHLVLTHRCNLRCRHCYISAGSAIADELLLEDWMKGFNNLFSVVPKPDITISGGEPTTVEFVSELVSFLREKVGRIYFYTNGTNPLGSITYQVDEVQVSLEGLSATTHDYIRGNGAYKKVFDFISQFPEKNKLTVALTIMHHNFEEVKNNLKKWLATTGLESTNMRLNAELEIDGRAENLPNEFHDFHNNRAISIFKFIAEIEDSINEPRILLKNMRNCGIGISIGIDSNGDIYPCDCLINKQGNIFDVNLEECIKKCVSINERTEIDNIEFCSDCDLKYLCLGGCKVKNLKANGSYIKPACNEKSRYIKYAKMIYDVGF